MSVDEKHPSYSGLRTNEFCLMQDALDGEGAVKYRKEKYLPKPSGFAAQPDNGKAHRHQIDF